MKKVSFLTVVLFAASFALVFAASLSLQAQRGQQQTPASDRGTQPQSSRPSTQQQPQQQAPSNARPSSQTPSNNNAATPQNSRPSTQQQQPQQQAPSNARPSSQTPPSNPAPPNSRPSQSNSPSRTSTPPNSRPDNTYYQPAASKPNFSSNKYPNRTIVHYHTPKTVHVLPVGYRTYRHSGVTYSFHNGYYYRPYGGTYVICRPPVGFVITAVSLRTVALTPVIFTPAIMYYQPQYYYSHGTYYIKNSYSQYRVVSPPIGAQVPYLPEDYEEFILYGNTYYKVDDTYYAPVFVNGRIMFEVVGKEIW